MKNASRGSQCGIKASAGEGKIIDPSKKPTTQESNREHLYRVFDLPSTLFIEVSPFSSPFNYTQYPQRFLELLDQFQNRR